MVDKVKPLKYENNSSGGTEVDYLPTEVDSNEDYLTGKGFSFENSDSFLLEKVGSILKCLTPSRSIKYNFSMDNLSSIEVFNGFTQTTINRIAKLDLGYTGDNATSESWKIYSPTDGTTILRTITFNHTYSGDVIQKTEVSEA